MTDNCFNRISSLKKYKHFLALVLLLPISVWFNLLERFLVPKYIIEVLWDNYIPFTPIFVIPYIFWFLYIAFGCVYTGIKSKENYYKLLFFLTAGMSTAYITYMFFPNGLNMRPSVYGDDIFSALVRYIYRTDTPTNICPSVHVINAFAVSAVLWHTKPFCDKRGLKYLLFVLFILICMSTVFIKQHSVFDVFCGLLVGSMIYIPLYKLDILEPAFIGKLKDSGELLTRE